MHEKRQAMWTKVCVESDPRIFVQIGDSNVGNTFRRRELLGAKSIHPDEPRRGPFTIEEPSVPPRVVVVSHHRRSRVRRCHGADRGRLGAGRAWGQISGCAVVPRHLHTLTVVTMEDDFRKRRKRLDEELAITRRVANEIIGLTAHKARAVVEAAGRQWAENCVTNDLRSHRVQVTVETAWSPRLRAARARRRRSRQAQNADHAPSFQRRVRVALLICVHVLARDSRHCGAAKGCQAA